MLKRISTAFLATTLLTAVVQSQTAPSVFDQIIAESKSNSQASNILRELCKDIGPRLTSSTNIEKSYAWAVQKFNEFGCVNVRLEEWSEWPLGFDRGPSYGRMVAPEYHKFEFTTNAWTAGTDGIQRGPIVLAPTTKAEFEALGDTLKGAWVVYSGAIPRPPAARQGQTPNISAELREQLEVEELLAKSEMLGRVYGSRNEYVMTHGSFRDKTYDNYPKDVTIMVRKSDLDKILALHEGEAPVEIEFNLEHTFRPGPIKNYNVVAEIVGSELPDEVVLFGAHIDTWDGPGAEGASDNGIGVTVALEAARIINKLGIKPKRTIRFVLFSGEEQGLLGSRAYVEMHKDQLDKFSAIFVEDSGANYQSGTYALATQMPFFEPIIEAMNRAFPDMPMQMRQVDAMPTGGGSDHVPFNAVGVPGFFWGKAGTFSYQFIYHNQNDRFEYVPTPYLVQAATNSTVALVSVANAPTLMPRQPRPTGN